MGAAREAVIAMGDDEMKPDVTTFHNPTMGDTSMCPVCRGEMEAPYENIFTAVRPANITTAVVRAHQPTQQPALKYLSARK